MTVTTRKQREAIHRVWRNCNNGKTYREFRASVSPTFGCNNAVTVKWSGMWLCIETDGYVHS